MAGSRVCGSVLVKVRTPVPEEVEDGTLLPGEVEVGALVPGEAEVRTLLLEEVEDGALLQLLRTLPNINIATTDK